MAVHMSKKLLEKQNNISPFVKNIIKTQEDDILFLKNVGVSCEAANAKWCKN